MAFTFGSIGDAQVSQVPAPPTYSRPPTSGAIRPATPANLAKVSTPVKDLRKSAKDVPSYRGFIQVCVGKGVERQSFDIHEYLINARSDFFKNAMSGSWKEAKDRVVKLPEDDPVTFNRYVHFLYTGTLAVLSYDFAKRDTGHEKSTWLAHLYVLAEKLQDIDTKNAVLEAMFLTCSETSLFTASHFPGAKTVLSIYRGTPSGSPMRKLLVDIYTCRGKAHSLPGPREMWPTDFVHDLALQLLAKRELPADHTKNGDASAYMETRVKKEA